MILNQEVYQYNSLLSDDKKILGLVREQTAKRRTNSSEEYYIPESFEEISEDTFLKMKKIDSIYQKGIITFEIAIEIITNLFRSNGIRERFEKYADDVIMEKYKRIYQLVDSKFQDLLYALNSGKIDYNEFLRKYEELEKLFANSIKEIEHSADILRKPKR